MALGWWVYFAAFIVCSVLLAFLAVRVRDQMRAANEPVRIRVKPDVRPFRRQLRRSMRRVPPSLDERDGHHRGKSARTDMTP